MALVVITGANRGIGLALVEEALKRGDKVVAVCRHSSSELDRSGAEVIAGIEVTEGASVAKLADKLAGRRIDVLINNAGIHRHDHLGELDFERIRQQFETNALGPLRVTEALLPLMHEGSKVAIITSRSGSIGDNGSGGTYGYRMSKAAVNMAGVNLALELKPRGIAVGILHPGMVRTAMSSSPQAVPAADSARRLMDRIAELSLANSGKFLHADGSELPW
ncbi:MAG: SDR family oxidoreductase [Rhizobiales bacterium]|nr:SDR family oxidoreductase [Hyphomicrobiales bacterium]